LFEVKKKGGGESREALQTQHLIYLNRCTPSCLPFTPEASKRDYTVYTLCLLSIRALIAVTIGSGFDVRLIVVHEHDYTKYHSLYRFKRFIQYSTL
jgi:isoprenylcysteine carboxyl methyltransferase (ICMT) family protein YpbQ